MTKRKSKTTKVAYRKLGRERAWGQAFIGEGYIEVDPRLGARRKLEVLCHEQAHLCLPEASEASIDALGKAISKMLWSQNYRQVVLEKNDKPPRIS